MSSSLAYSITTGLIKEYFQNNGNPVHVHREYYVVDGRREGEYRDYYPNGTLRTTLTYVNNLKEGEGRHFSHTGNLQIVAHYKDDKLNGEYVSYMNDGRVYKIRYFVNDVMVCQHVINPYTESTEINVDTITHCPIHQLLH